MVWLVLGLIPLMDQTPSDLAADEAIVFFNTIGWFDADRNEWAVRLHGWVFEPERDSTVRRSSLALLADALDVDEDARTVAVFRSRTLPFLVDNERGKRVTIQIKDVAFRSDESSADGHFTKTIYLRNAIAKPPGENDGVRRLDFTALLKPGDLRKFTGSVQLLPPTGLSVVSDIDDTIRITEAHDTSRMIARTFMLEFEPAPGMVELYQQLSEWGAAFHYVSSSPWQLNGPLTDFMERVKYPKGSMHLHDFRWKERSFVDLIKDPEDRKAEAIEMLLKVYPERDFILIGDSGQHDPELYAEFARKHPKQVKRILIRRVESENSTAERFEKAFKNLPADLWTLFSNPKELNNVEHKVERQEKENE